MPIEFSIQTMMATIKAMKGGETYEALFENRKEFRAQCYMVLALDTSSQNRTQFMEIIKSAFRVYMTEWHQDTVGRLRDLVGKDGTDGTGTMILYFSDYCLGSPSPRD